MLIHYIFINRNNKTKDELSVYLRYVTNLAEKDNDVTFYFWISANLREVVSGYFVNFQNVKVLSVEEGLHDFNESLYLYDKLMNDQVMGEFRIPEAQIKDTLSILITNIYGGLFLDCTIEVTDLKKLLSKCENSKNPLFVLTHKNNSDNRFFYAPNDCKSLKEYVDNELKCAINTYDRRQYFRTPPFELAPMAFYKSFLRDNKDIDPSTFTVFFTILKLFIWISEPDGIIKHCTGSWRKK